MHVCVSGQENVYELADRVIRSPESSRDYDLVTRCHDGLTWLLLTLAFECNRVFSAILFIQDCVR